jgi:peptidoglycan/xylan/chitin deacetylase (PgdA/CDA1 family)
MNGKGVEIGFRTVNHVRLTEIDDVRLSQELTDSKAALDELLGKTVNSFAYPYGPWDERCADAVKHAGYRAARTTLTGWALRDKNLFSLRRLTVFNPDTVSTLVRELSFESDDVTWGEIARYSLQRIRYRTSIQSES